MPVFSGDPFGIQAAKLEDFYKFTEQDQTKLTLTGKITIMKRYNTAAGPLDIEILDHSSVIMHWNGQVIHIDPYSEEADYSEQPKANLILVTHHHSDHFDPDAIAEIRKKDTVVISTEKVAHALEGVTVLHNGERTTWNGITIRATPAYNIVNMRAPGEPFHIPGEGNGYVMEIDPLRIYIAGDTELIPEMSGLEAIDIAFLPKDVPYTMNDSMFIEAARVIRPKILLPYHCPKPRIDRTMLRNALPGMTIPEE